MVGYGDILCGSRRNGWEDAYLDYEHLKVPITRIEVLSSDESTSKSTSTATIESTQSHSYSETLREVNKERDHFLSLLKLEIEKVSLFALSRQGVLADAVGALTFNTDLSMDRIHRKFPVSECVINSPSKPKLQIIHSDVRSALRRIETKGDGALNYLRHRSAILPVLEHSTTKTTSVSSPSLSSYDQSNQEWMPRPLFQGLFEQNLESEDNNNNSKSVSQPQHVLRDLDTVLDYYTYLGVELLHLLRFICVNAVAVRKIIKKYVKVLSEFKNWEMTHRPKGQSEIEEDDVEYLSIDTYEAHLHQLANSHSMAAIQSSLSARLDEFQQDPGSVHHSSILRLKGVIYCLKELLKYSKVVNRPYDTFLSRKAMIVTGDVGLGDLDAPTLQALEVMLKFNPDALLDMDDRALGTWNRNADGLRHQSYSFDSFMVMASDSTEFSKESDKVWGGLDRVSMILNLTSTLLYTVNYYIVAPTANHYAILLGTDGAFGATLVGASSFAAIFAAFLYSLWYTTLPFKYGLVLSSLCPCIGNLLYASAIKWKSMRVALLGRFLVGFGSAEVINRQVISMCCSYNYMTKASALFVAASALGMSIGPLFAAILHNVAGFDAKVDINLPVIGGIIINHVTAPGFLMMLLWFVEMVCLLLFFSEPDRINGAGYKGDESRFVSDDGYLSDSGAQQPRQADYGSLSKLQNVAKESFSTNSERDVLIEHKREFSVEANLSIWNQMKRINQLIFQNPSLPITLLIFAYIELADEVLISSCSMVCHRYFSWPGSKAGFLIASLGALVLPAHYVVERASRTYEERVILKWSILFICGGLFAILNYQGLKADVTALAASALNAQDDIINVHIETNQTMNRLLLTQTPYDWDYGKIVYLVSISAIFMGTIILEGVDTSLMSKAASPELNDTFINTGLLATLIGTMGRVLGDSMITISALIDHMVFTDFLNDTFFPMIPMGLLGFYLIRKYYSYLK